MYRLQKHKLVLLLVWLLLYVNLSHSQENCNPASAPVTYVCQYNNYAVGVSTLIGSSYVWYLNGKRKGDPVPGDGGAISFSFQIASGEDAGQYTVEQSGNGPTMCVYNEIVVINSPLSQLQTNAVTSNSVNFSWQGTGKFYYFINVSSTAPGNPATQQANSPTGNANVTINGLSGNTTYYIFIRSECNTEWSTVSFTTTNGPCTAFAAHSVLSGGGQHCIGSTVSLPVTNTVSTQSYTWLREGVPVYGPIVGNGSTISYEMPFTSLSQAGQYTVQITKSGCSSNTTGSISISGVGPVTSIQSVYVSEVGAKYSWSPPFVGYSSNYNYAVTTSASPPASYSLTGNTQAFVNQLTPNTNYFFHVRPGCAGPSAGWTSIPFTTTTIQPFNCAAITVIQECVPVTITIEPGAGPWNMGGIYPYNSSGYYSTAGKEKLLHFTPSASGVYYIDQTEAISSEQISYLYKKASEPCSNQGWTGIKVYGGKYSIGMLDGGVTYQFLLDAEYTEGTTQTIKICRSNVNSAITNTCLTGRTIPSMSPKEEFIIDDNGNLLASVDYSLANASESASSQVYDNGAMIRRDQMNREYLDRHFYFNMKRVKLKLFFPNSELQRLINEPNDGIADVSGIGDLKVSVMNVICANGLGTTTTGKLIGQIGNGAYDATSSYILLEAADMQGTLFIHGGNELLNSSCAAAKSVGYTEGFNVSGTIPSCWQETKAGASVSVIQPNDTSMTSVEGNSFLFYRSSVFTAGSTSTLSMPRFTTPGASPPVLSFYWYNSHNPSKTSALEGVRVEYSLNNVSFTQASFVQRHDASLPANTGKWKKIKIQLPGATANQANLYIRLVLVSQQGNDCALDYIRLSNAAACADVPAINITSLASNSAQVSWTPSGSITRYRYDIFNMTDQVIAANPAIITGTTTSFSNLSPHTTYQVKISPECSVGVIGEENIIVFKTTGGCPGFLPRFVSPHATTGNFFFWEVNMGNGFQDIVNNSIYSGATTSALLINPPDSSYQNYQYRCRAYVNFNTFYSQPFRIVSENTWTGASSTLWDQASNWSCGIIPDSNTEVIIQPGVTNFPMINNNTATCKKITIKKGGVVNIGTGFKLTITGSQ